MTTGVERHLRNATLDVEGSSGQCVVDGSADAQRHGGRVERHEIVATAGVELDGWFDGDDADDLGDRDGKNRRRAGARIVGRRRFESDHADPHGRVVEPLDPLEFGAVIVAGRNLHDDGGVGVGEFDRGDPRVSIDLAQTEPVDRTRDDDRRLIGIGRTDPRCVGVSVVGGR